MRCSDCGGPCLTWKGNVHRNRCASCVERAIGLDRELSRYQRRTSYFIESYRRRETA